MTNLLVSLTVVRLLTNCITTTVCSDGKGGVLRQEKYIISAESQTVRVPVSSPPIPRSKTSMHQASMASSSALTDPGLFLSAASVHDPDCQCPLFRVSFLAQTNHIYSFQRSHDLLNWELRPPEIDGDPGVNAFYDVFEGAAMYRVVSREGVLP